MKQLIVMFAVAIVFAAAESHAVVSTMIDVDVLPPGQNLWIAQLSLSTADYDVTDVELDDTRYYVDIRNAVWPGDPENHDSSGGVFCYRWAQFSSQPPVLRFVVEHARGWSCSVQPKDSTIIVRCHFGRSDAGQRDLVLIEDARPDIVATVRGVDLRSPLAGHDSLALLRRSLLYLPADIVRDGLPHFGAVRDDWLGHRRLHKGFDIYVDQCDVIAMADGTVVGIGRGERAGGWIKIGHEHGVESLYVHVRKIFVSHGERVDEGHVIGRIEGPEGNGIEAQLHLEIRIDGESVDPAIRFRDAARVSDHAEWQRAIDAIPEREKIRGNALPESLQ